MKEIAQGKRKKFITFGCLLRYEVDDDSDEDEDQNQIKDIQNMIGQTLLNIKNMSTSYN